MRRILITGGTSGIGRAVADRLALTDKVWILGSSEQSVEAVPEPDRFAGVRACNVADEAAAVTAVNSAAEAMGGIDSVFVNAGIDGEGKSAAELSLEHFRQVLAVNVLGAFTVARTALAILSRPGTILFNASVNAIKPEVDFLDYNASKAAVVSMAKSMALEVSGDHVTVLALCPGYFPTRMTEGYMNDPGVREKLLRQIPAGRFGELEEAAATVDFLLSPAARFMNGGVVTLDGGTYLAGPVSS